MQMIELFDQVWSAAGLPLLLRPYAVLVTSHDSGMIETVTGTCSIDGLKKGVPGKHHTPNTYLNNSINPSLSSPYNRLLLYFYRVYVARQVLLRLLGTTGHGHPRRCAAVLRTVTRRLFVSLLLPPNQG